VVAGGGGGGVSDLFSCIPSGGRDNWKHHTRTLRIDASGTRKKQRLPASLHEPKRGPKLRSPLSDCFGKPDL